MADQKRRIEIQIETHEITIIRSGKLHNVSAVERLLEEADVVAHAAVDPKDTTATEEKEKQNEK